MNTIAQILGTEFDDLLEFTHTSTEVFGLAGDDILTTQTNQPLRNILISGGEGQDTLSHSGTLELGDGVTFEGVEILDVTNLKVIAGATVDLSGFETSTADKIVGTSGNETIIGTQDSDRIFTRAGDDVVQAGAGDFVNMGRGNDTLQYIQDGTAVLDVNNNGHGTVTYDNGDIITFKNVENFEEIIPETEYVLDFNDGVRIENGDTILDGNFVANIGLGQFNRDGSLNPFDYDFASVDDDLEAFNAWGAQTIGFTSASGDDFDFRSVSLGNTSNNRANIAESSWADTIQITGFNDGLEVYSESVDLTFEHTTQTLGWENIDEIQFVVTGGGITDNNVQNTGIYSMDDLVFIA